MCILSTLPVVRSISDIVILPPAGLSFSPATMCGCATQLATHALSEWDAPGRIVHSHMVAGENATQVLWVGGDWDKPKY